MTSDCNNENKNDQALHCQHCNSLILRQNLGEYVKQQHMLPLIHQKNSKLAEEIECESLEDFWLVDNMFTFENIGFSNTVDGCKYLVCADCDMGPVGYHELDTKLSYIARQRVRLSAGHQTPAKSKPSSDEISVQSS